MRVTMKAVTLTLAVSLAVLLLGEASNADAKGRAQSSERGGHGYKRQPPYPNGNTPGSAPSFPGNAPSSIAPPAGGSSPVGGPARTHIQNSGSTIRQD